MLRRPAEMLLLRRVSSFTDGRHFGASGIMTFKSIHGVTVKYGISHVFGEYTCLQKHLYKIQI